MSRRDLIGAWHRPKQAVSGGRPLSVEVKGTRAMIVLGADMHKSSHTIAAVSAIAGELLGGQTVVVGDRGFSAALDWARSLGAERVWALEDCRHVSGALECFLLVQGERVVRVATRLMAGERRGGRDRGKSDRIDAIAVARAALREGVDRLPVAELAGVGLEIRLLVDHRERLVRMRTALYNDLLWHLHDPSWRCLVAHCSQRSGRRASGGAWDAPSRPHASGSLATSSVTSASSRTPSTRSRQRSPISSPRSRRSCWPSRASGR
jgi:hypothetical protein